MLTHRRTVDIDDPYTDAWVKDKGSMDIRGIDAPGKAKQAPHTKEKKPKEPYTYDEWIAKEPVKYNTIKEGDVIVNQTKERYRVVEIKKEGVPGKWEFTLKEMDSGYIMKRKLGNVERYHRMDRERQERKKQKTKEVTKPATKQEQEFVEARKRLEGFQKTYTSKADQAVFKKVMKLDRKEQIEFVNYFDTPGVGTYAAMRAVGGDEYAKDKILEKKGIVTVEKVNVHGLKKTRWRCPECGRATRGGWCDLHGEVKPTDLKTADKQTKEQAFELGLDKIIDDNKQKYKRRGTVTINQLAKDTGADKEYLETFLAQQDPQTEERWGNQKSRRETYEQVYGITIPTPSRAELWLTHAERPDKERRRDERNRHSHIVDENDPKDAQRWMKDPKAGGDVEGIDTPQFEGLRSHRSGTGRQRGEMAKQEKDEITYIARTTNSTFFQAKALRSLAHQKGLNYDEVDWDQIQGRDLTHSEKKQKLSKLLGSTKGMGYYTAMEHDRNIEAVKKAIREGREGDVRDIVRGHKKRPEKPQKPPSRPLTVDQRLRVLFQDKHKASSYDLTREAAYKHRMGAPHEAKKMIQDAIKSGKLTRNPDGSYSLPKQGSWKAPRQADLTGKKEEQTAFKGSTDPGSPKKIRRDGWKDLQEPEKKKKGRATDMREFGVEKPNEPSIERFTKSHDPVKKTKRISRMVGKKEPWEMSREEFNNTKGITTKGV